MPPVANTRIALACAANMVAATVVEPGSPDETAAARLLRLILATLGVVASCSNSVAREPDADGTADDADGRRRSTSLANDLFQ